MILSTAEEQIGEGVPRAKTLQLIFKTFLQTTSVVSHYIHVHSTWLQGTRGHSETYFHTALAYAFISVHTTSFFAG